MPESSDTTVIDHPSSPYFKTACQFANDRADFLRRADQVADRHLRTASPEFVRWLSSRLDDEQIATIFGAMWASDLHQRIVRNSFAKFYDEWAEYVRTNPHALRTEIAREA